MQSEYWLYSYLDDGGVRTDRDAYRLAADRGFRSAIFEHGLRLGYAPTQEDHSDSSTILAGHGIDLSLSTKRGCTHTKCMRAKVDQALAMSFHFFDTIAVEGPSTHAIVHLLDTYPDDRTPFSEEQIVTRLGLHLVTLIHLRKIGASKIVQFINKPPACEIHYREHLEDVGLTHLSENSRSIVRDLATTGSLHQYEEHGNHFDYKFEHPLLAGVHAGIVHKRKGVIRVRNPKLAVAEAIFREYSANLVADVTATRNIRSPLAFALPFSARLAKNTIDHPLSAALTLNIPALAGISAETAIRMRQEAPEAFDKFKVALRLAVQERLNLADEDPAGAIMAVRSDVIDPALNDITLRVKKSHAVRLMKISTNAIASGGMLMVGAWLQLPLLLSAGLATGSASILHQNKFVEEMRDIQLSDMYFLWQAANRSHSPSEI